MSAQCKSDLNHILLRIEAAAIAENHQDLERCLAEGESKLRESENVLDEETFSSIETSLASMSTILEQQKETETGVFRFRAEKITTGVKGRPKLNISREQLLTFRNASFTSTKMADHFQCSNKTVYRRLKAEGLQPRYQYTGINNTELDLKVSELKQSFPKAGNQMMQGYLATNNIHVQRRRVRDSVKRVDPDGSLARWSTAVHRRIYQVATPNSLWHLDGHMKLIRWGFVTHGCIDGFSRLITFLKCSDNNTSSTVLHEFVKASASFGLPSRVRSDHGMENTKVALFLNLLRDRPSHIAGKSTHNQRIERLWRDMHYQVTSRYHHEFYTLEEDYNFEDPIQRKALHYVYLPAINKDLQVFRKAWNLHKLRSEKHRSPHQIWLSGMLDNIGRNYTSTEELFGHPQDLGERLHTSLARFNLTLEDVGVTEPVSTHILSVAEQSAITPDIHLLTNNKEKLKQCIEALKDLSS